MDAQEEHDYRMSQRRSLKGSRHKLEDLLEDKNASSKSPPQKASQDPIATAIKNNPGLTREKAVEMAEKFGF